MESTDIDSDSLQAVKNLRSKFEKLAQDKSSDLLTLTAPSSPRPRATSSNYLSLPSPDSPVGHGQLRSSSSSSDLRPPAKRAPPPPPPPRASKILNNQSPSNSPSSSPLSLHRPAPIISPSPISPSPREQPPSRNLTSTSPARSPSPFLLSRPVPIPSSNSLKVDLRDQSLGIISPSAQKRFARSQPVSPIKIENSRNTLSTFSETITSDIPAPVSRSAPRSILVPPPRPPPRNHHPFVSPGRDPSLLSSSAQSLRQFASPPPLPVRRGTNISPEELPPPSIAPPLPSRSQFVSPSNGDNERKPLGSNKLPPPPTRTIALGDKLPPRQVATLSSDDESGEEDDLRTLAVDLMPDNSTSSRRPPQLAFRDGYSESCIHVHPQTDCVALSGTYVVVGRGHHIKIFDLAKSEVPLLNLDTKDIGAKDSKVTCMEFRPSLSREDRGYLLWVGTKEGHIFELDIRTGFIRGIKHSAHLHHVVHLFRHSRSMVTLDESGKALIFSPDVSNQEDISLALTVPRVVRTTEKQDFVKMLDGKLWTAARADYHSASTQKLPIIRVFDLFNSSSNTGRSLLPTEHVGPVTSATMLPSQPGMVYLGHEEGFISMWELKTEDGYPRCMEVMKVSVSDVLSLEGVSNRLWAGSRNGMISAYDVSQKPWLVTNCWNAHPGVPVMKLMVNHYAITKVGRLCVASIGRDEQLRLWDGLLGWDWVDKELVKSEASFSTFRDLTILVVSWNCDSARPDSLNGDPQNYNFLNEALHSVDSPPDIIVFGFQEVIDLESRKMVAKNVLLGGKKKTDDGLSDKVTGAYKRWHDRLVLAVRAAMPKDVVYCVAHTESLIGLFSCIFVKNTERPSFDDVSITTIKRGMGGRYGNKGGIVARFVVGDSSICFINCHLAAGQGAVRQRNADVAGMLEEKAVFSPTIDHGMAYIGGGDGTMVLDHEFVVLNGDMNYRIDHRRDTIIAAIRAGDLASLLPHDQLLREMKYNRGCRLRGFSEGLLTFNPTYKYDPRSDEYDSSVKHRSPAWCDRILWRSRVANRVQQLHYERYEANVSDHRPISAAFSVTVKSFDYEARENWKAVLQNKWLERQEELLVAARGFYVSQALI